MVVVSRSTRSGTNSRTTSNSRNNHYNYSHCSRNNELVERFQSALEHYEQEYLGLLLQRFAFCGIHRRAHPGPLCNCRRRGDGRAPRGLERWKGALAWRGADVKLRTHKVVQRRKVEIRLTDKLFTTTSGVLGISENGRARGIVSPSDILPLFGVSDSRP